MSPTDVLPEQATKASVVGESTLLAGICLTSFAALLLELSLTRLFSVVLFYHFAFLAISVALLGLGAGGVLAHLQRERLLRWDPRELGGRLCLFCAVVIFLLLQIILHTSVSLHLSAASSRAMAVLYITAMIPFVFAGLLFSVVFARHPARISRLYGADLAGGALACLATALGEFSEPDSIEWAWAMNAAASVLGSGLAIVLAMCFGLSITLACGGVAYCLAMILVSSLRTRAA